MIKIDLITGFLGSGKTTFMKKYAQYLMDHGFKVGILENDYGAVNVDMMLLQDLEGDSCGLEMVAGGCDADCHRRRFKTKLIAMGMSGYDRVLVEPSGIFDVDEFFDALYEEPLSRWYEIGNVIAIVDGDLESELSKQSEFLLASQIANAGCVILSRTQEVEKSDIKETVAHMNRALEQFDCKRRFTLDAGDKEHDRVIQKSWDDFSDEDYNRFAGCGYRSEAYRKEYSEENGYMTLYFMNGNHDSKTFCHIARELFCDTKYGDIFRIKGFLRQNDGWVEVNSTHRGITVKPIEKGQSIIIVIGEHLKQPLIEAAFGMKANEL